MSSSLPTILSRKSGLSLIEVLIGVAVAAVLVALLTPVALRFQADSARTKCTANLRKIGVASGQFAGDHKGVLPNFYWATTEGAEPQAPAAAVGQWFWHLAPYLSVPRWENAGMNLGTQGIPISRPVVFTCPANTQDEANADLMRFPSHRPVSYAPPSYARGNTPMNLPELMASPSAGAYIVYPPVLQSIPQPSKKIWIADSPVASVLNVAPNRWSANYSPPSGAWARVGFTRHNGKGNALFYDGHVELIPLEQFTQPPDGINIVNYLRRFFDPYYEN